MSNQRIKIIFGIITAAIIAVISITCSVNMPKIIELSFEEPFEGANANETTLHSIQKVGEFYTVNYHGDYIERLQWLNEYHTKESARLNQTHCSLFATYTTTEEPLLGRNFDRLRETPVLAKFSAPGKYSSFAFSPASEVFLREVYGVEQPTEDQMNKFLYCLPFFATDGINEKGLSIAIAGAPPRHVERPDTCQPMFVLLFIRHVLDNCMNVEEVARFAETVALYDSDLGTISHHFVVVDASGHWLVIDYPNGDLRLLLGQGESQARSNHFLDGGSAIDNTSFWRYDKLFKALNSKGPMDSEYSAMDLLKRVRHDTKWSVVYESRSGIGLIAVKENYRKLYRFKFTNADS